MDASTDLSGVDCRLPRYRREVFLRFYGAHLRYGTHPGCVYHLLPAVAGPDPDTRGWAALLNGHTQNPVTTALLLREAPVPEAVDQLVEMWQAQYPRLSWDTDRRYSKARFAEAVQVLVQRVLDAGGPAAWWARPQRWTDLWAQVSALPTFGRLSTWSCIEYGRLLGLHDHDAASFLLADPGSRSHRLGAAWVAGLNAYDPHPSNPERCDDPWPAGLTAHLDGFLEELLAEAQDRYPGPDTSRLTMESALCTYKAWHRPRRRYTNVYADLAHDRIRAAEAAWPEVDLSALWEARAVALPDVMRLELQPGDPGAVPIKQDWYRTTGRPPMLDLDHPDLESGWADAVASGRYAHLRRHP